MKLLASSLLAIGLLLALAPAGAQDAGQTSFALEAHSEGGGGYFTLDGQTARNPTLTVPANTEITVTLKGMDDQGVHNVCYQSSTACSTGGADGYVEKAGDTVTLTFTSAASGSQDYFCLPHKSAGMAGKVQIAGSTTTPADGNGNDSPGLGVLGLGVAGLAAALLLARRK